jgi:hypothetical protein
MEIKIEDNIEYNNYSTIWDNVEDPNKSKKRKTPWEINCREKVFNFYGQCKRPK